MTFAQRLRLGGQGFVGALGFLTRLPVGHLVGTELAEPGPRLRQSLVFFPLVGGLIGAMAAIVLLLATYIFPLYLAVILALVVEMLVTGALHEDAVADFFDAFGGAWTKEDVLRILKDSRIGSFGVAGLVGALALRAGGLMATADPFQAAVVLIVSGAIGRALILFLVAMLQPVSGRQGLARDVRGGEVWKAFGISLLLASPTFLLGLIVDWRAMLVAILASALFTGWLRQFLLSRIGGVTGDCLGFAAYAGIVLSTIAFAARF